MCLYTNNKVPQKAESDMLCFKAMLVKDDDNIQTPFYQTRITKSVLDGKENFVAEGEEFVSDYRTRLYPYGTIVGDGFIHTYACYGDARRLQRSYSAKRGYGYRLGYRCKIYKCVIPKGTKYYEGETDRQEPCYAAKQIHFIEKV